MFETTIGPVQGGGLDRLPAPGDRAGHLPRLQERAAVRAHASRRSGSRRSASRSATRSRPGNFIFRTLEFEQMEMEFFVPPDRGRSSGTSTGCRSAWTGTSGSASDREHLRLRPHDADELSHYSSRHQRRRVPVSDRLVRARGHRQPRRLRPHASTREYSGEKLEYIDPQTGERYVPHVIEPAAGVGRSVLALLCDAYDEDEHRRRAAHRAAAAPGARAGQGRRAAAAAQGRPPRARARDLRRRCARRGCRAEYDEGGAIGKRYRRQDEIGTPFARHDRPPDARGRHRHAARPRHARRRSAIAIDALPDELQRAPRRAVDLAEAGLKRRQTGYVPLYMGEDVTATVFSREDRQRYRQKVRACLDVFARMLAESRFDPERRSMGLEIELNLTDEAGDPALLNADGARGDRRQRLHDRARAVQRRDQHPAAAADRRGVHRARAAGARQPQQRRGQVARRRART